MPASSCPSGRLLLAVLCVFGSCLSPETRFANEEASHRDDMAAKYPAGSQWKEPPDACGKFQRWLVASPAPDGFASRALEHARAQSDAVIACQWGLVHRGSLASAFPNIGTWRDYVFLDAQDRVVVAFRHFFD